MVWLNVALLSILSLASASSVNIASLFGPSLSPGAKIYLPSDANYTTDLAQRWAVYQEPSYIGAIKPATEQDIQNIIKIAARYGIPFLPTGGGHGVSTTLAGIHGGIDLDLGNFKTVNLDAANNRLTVGGATRFSQIIDLLYAAKKELPITSASCVGMLGATLGAGVSTLQGVRGLLIDSLESVRVITGNGRIVTASKTENAPLFWGMRGAGYNFGIVTSATYKIYDSTNQGQLINADFLFPASMNRSVWEMLASFDTMLPAELAVSIVVGANVTTREALIAVNAIYYGSIEAAMPHIQPIIDLKAPVSSISVVPSNKELDAAFFGLQPGACLDRNRVNIYSLGLKQTNAATWESCFNDLAAFYVQHPTYQGRLLAERYATQAVLAVPDGETAYAYREAKIQLNLEGWYTDPSLDPAVNAFLTGQRAKFQSTSGFDDLSIYTNYAHGDEGPVAWYSRRKLGQLVGLKLFWDPQGLFSWYNPIPGYGW